MFEVAVLLQKQPGDTIKPVGCCFRFLTDAKTRYDTSQLECLAIVRITFPLEPYLKD